MCYVFDFHCVIGKEQFVDIMVSSSPGCALEGLMLKPKLQYFGHLM